MAFTYTWEVTGLKTKSEVNAQGETLENAVVQTYWKLTGTDENGNEGDFSGATPFTALNVPAGEFVSFEQLTEETVLSWIKAVVNGDATYKAHIDAQIQKKIDDSLNVLQDKPLPWDPTRGVTPSPVVAAEQAAAQPAPAPEADPA